MNPGWPRHKIKSFHSAKSRDKLLNVQQQGYNNECKVEVQHHKDKRDSSEIVAVLTVRGQQQLNAAVAAPERINTESILRPLLKPACSLEVSEKNPSAFCLLYLLPVIAAPFLTSSFRSGTPDILKFT